MNRCINSTGDSSYRQLNQTNWDEPGRLISTSELVQDVLHSQVETLTSSRVLILTAISSIYSLLIETVRLWLNFDPNSIGYSDI
jgi:hypothetical protein